LPVARLRGEAVEHDPKEVWRMKQMALASLCAVALALLVGCQAEPPLALVIEIGCVTASHGEFILTDLEPGGELTPRRPTTAAYVLTGAEMETSKLVGQRVRVTGEASPEEAVDVRLIEPMYKARPSNDSIALTAHDSRAPKVGVGYQMRLEVSSLLVRAIEPTGDTCVGGEPG
jgi:hypothetical protein